MRNYRKIGSRQYKFPNKEAKLEAIEQALQRLASEGLIFNSGERRWSEQTGRYEIVWKSRIYERPN